MDEQEREPLVHLDQVTPAAAGTIKLSCRSVWKLFGDAASGFVPAGSRADDDQTLRTAGAIAAVRDVSLDVVEGEIFVIMGLSGSGKSTLVRCMSRLIEPSAGQILFNGENLLSAPERRMIDIRRHQMGMVFQHFALLPHLSVLGNVAFPLEIQGMQRDARAKVVRVRSIMRAGADGAEQVSARQVSMDAPVAEAAPLFAGSTTVFTVVDASGAVVGRLHRDDVSELMMMG